MQNAQNNVPTNDSRVPCRFYKTHRKHRRRALLYLGAFYIMHPSCAAQYFRVNLVKSSVE